MRAAFEEGNDTRAIPHPESGHRAIAYLDGKHLKKRTRSMAVEVERAAVEDSKVLLRVLLM